MDSTASPVLTSVQRAFSKQADHYDSDDCANNILQEWRQQVYRHLDHFLKPNSRMLELNAGTGIDALHFVASGHSVHATDISPGMIQKIQEKINGLDTPTSFTAQQCSFEELGTLQKREFDYVFSNFGGLNCCDDLTRVTQHLPDLLINRAYVTWVIMPPICLWELASLLKGKKTAFRRLHTGGTPSHLEGESFITYYHSLATVKGKLGNHFHLRRIEGLGTLSPPPASLAFTKNHPLAYNCMKNIDLLARHWFPFNRWSDHFIATFQYIK